MARLGNMSWIWMLLVSILILNCAAIPKYDNNAKAHVAENSDWKQGQFNENNSSTFDLHSPTTKDRLQRLGYTTGYGTINGYPGSTGISAYNPIKLDLGGVVLGTLVGIGAIIIIPKLLNAFHGGYAGYGRSENENDLSSISNFMSKIDDILGQNNIDSTSCMQRAVCSYVRSTEYNMRTGASDRMDEYIHMLSENALVDYLLDGTAIKEALEVGKKVNGDSCEKIYTSCQMDNKTATNVLMKLLPKKPISKLQSQTSRPSH
ncbi:uncharacterized protein LOC101457849 [Ceratitis capitata]|uniref:(Mediterranean fruit fly) hypothetical protein n=2 Tax=Ceratitis capitata TaxID=7213 RepID=A0A811U9H0_CERCA|nr:uncharacterized protein LOC101457849 [Ceratitis capitata]CAD6994766.1 unnamed protein product [Ceratitis capitata]